MSGERVLYERCEACEGNGWVTVLGELPDQERCEECDGWGRGLREVRVREVVAYLAAGKDDPHAEPLLTEDGIPFGYVGAGPFPMLVEVPDE